MVSRGIVLIAALAAAWLAGSIDPSARGNHLAMAFGKHLDDRWSNCQNFSSVGARFPLRSHSHVQPLHVKYALGFNYGCPARLVASQ